MEEIEKSSALYIRPPCGVETHEGSAEHRANRASLGQHLLRQNSPGGAFLAQRAYEYYAVTEDGRLELPEKPVSRARIVVVDDLHRLWRPEARAQLLPKLIRLAAAPKVWLILMGRPALPAWLRPLSFRGAFTALGEDLLCLSAAEEAVPAETAPLPGCRGLIMKKTSPAAVQAARRAAAAAKLMKLREMARPYIIPALTASTAVRAVLSQPGTRLRSYIPTRTLHRAP